MLCELQRLKLKLDIPPVSVYNAMNYQEKS